MTITVELTLIHSRDTFLKTFKKEIGKVSFEMPPSTSFDEFKNMVRVYFNTTAKEKYLEMEYYNNYFEQWIKILNEKIYSVAIQQKKLQVRVEMNTEREDLKNSIGNIFSTVKEGVSKVPSVISQALDEHIYNADPKLRFQNRIRYRDGKRIE